MSSILGNLEDSIYSTGIIFQLLEDKELEDKWTALVINPFEDRVTYAESCAQTLCWLSELFKRVQVNNPEFKDDCVHLLKIMEIVNGIK